MRKLFGLSLVLSIGLAGMGCPGGEEQTCIDNEDICAGAAFCNEETGRCEAAELADDCTDTAVCGEGTTCDEETGLCVAGQPDCRVDEDICLPGTTCDEDTGRCRADDFDCREDDALCGDGTVCDSSSGLCVRGEIDCRDDGDLCGEGTVCDEDSGLCIATADCRVNDSLCGDGTTCDDDTGLCMPVLDCDVAGEICSDGTICGADGVCRADCRLNFSGICGNEMLCNHTTGACEIAEVLDCNLVPGLCWEDQICDTATGYCREAEIDTSLPLDVQVYDLKIDLLTATNNFEAELNVYFIATGQTSEIQLDVGEESEVDGAMHNPYIVTSVTDASGADLDFEQDAEAGLLTIELDETLASGEGQVITIAYNGEFNPIDDGDNPLYSVGLAIRDGDDDNEVLMTMGWPNYTSRWMPCNDHPSDGARFIANVGIDNDFKVLSNGLLVKEESVDGLSRRTFVLRQQVPVYSLSITASNFVKVPLGVVDGVSVDAYMYPKNADIPAIHWSDALGALRYFNTRLGQYPFEVFGIVQFASIYDGMEHATLVSIGEPQVNAPHRGVRAVVHELSHHWWGTNTRQERWEEFWLNESLAEFFDAEHRRIQLGAMAYEERMANRRGWLLALPHLMNTHPLRYSYDEEAVPSFTNATGFAPYIKGPWVWHMLRNQVGEEAFDAITRTFYEETRLSTYDTVGLMALVNQVTGEDFDWFFDEWVYQAGWPQIEFTWEYEAADEEITVEVSQVQDEAHGTYTFDGPFALTFHFDDADTETATCTVTVTMTGGQTTSTASGECTYEPISVATPFLKDVLVEIL